MKVVVGGSISDFLQMLGNVSGGCVALGHALAQRLAVPYLTEREGERRLGHRLRTQTKEEALAAGLLLTRKFRLPSGEEIDTNDFNDPRILAADQLTEEVWTHDNWPESYNTCEAAVAKVPNGIIGVFYHRPSMNLVLVGPAGELVGIYSVEFQKRRNVSLLANIKKHSALEN